MSEAASVFVLSISARLQNGEDTVHPAVVYDGVQAILIDTCLPGAARQIMDAMEEAGVPLSALTHIVLTHADMDHTGSLKELLALAPKNVQVLCHEREKSYVQGDVPPLRLAAMEAAVENMMGEKRAQFSALAQSLRSGYKNLAVPVTGTVEDGEMLPCGVQVIFTPGHTPGHISLYLISSRTLIAGDVLSVLSGELLPAPDWSVGDKELMRASLKKLAELDIETVVCFHGGVFSDSVRERLLDLAGMNQ